MYSTHILISKLFELPNMYLYLSLLDYVTFYLPRKIPVLIYTINIIPVTIKFKMIRELIKP